MQRKTIKSEALFPAGAGRPAVDWNCLLEHLLVEYLPSKDDARRLVQAAAALFG